MRTRRGRPLTSATFGLLLLSALLATASCSGESKKTDSDAPAGAAGEGAAGGSSDGGTSFVGGSPGSETAGSGNPAEAGSAGAGTPGSAGEGGSSGSGNEPVAPFGLLFSVAPGAIGLAQTGVADVAPDAQSSLFRSSGSGATHVAGTNALGYGPAELGVDDADDLDAISAVHPAVASAFYFSVFDIGTHAEGVDGTGVRRSSTAGEVKSDIFMSYGLAPLNGNGSNIEWVDEYRLGLEPIAEGDSAADDLNALDIDVPPGTKPLFFSVAPGALGAAASALAAVSVEELGCTIFSSQLDGTNEVAFSCADLGLVAGDDVDALVVLGAGAAARTVLFSVTRSSVGAVGSAVAQQAGQAGADVFASDGTGTNVLHIEERALGLLPEDELDALAIETASSPLATWLPPPPEDPPPPMPAPCSWPKARVRTNAGANKPVANSLPARGSRVATPSGRIIRSSGQVRRLKAADAARINALQGCGSSRDALPGSSGTRIAVICPAGATELAAGDYFVGAIETQEPLDANAWQQLQIAVVLDTDADPANNYLAKPPYTFDTFDGTDRVIQLQKSGNSLISRAQDISVNPFQNIPQVADRVIIQGQRYIFIVQVEDPIAYPYRFTFYLAGQNIDEDWSMSNVNPVGEAMEIADLESCE